MAKFKKGDVVQQIISAPIVGTVVGFAVDQETGDTQMCIEWKDAAGGVATRHFTEDQVTLLQPAG